MLGLAMLAGLLATPAASVRAAGAQPPPAARATAPSVIAYHGLGAWIDIYDTGEWAHPLDVIRGLVSHHVRTLYLEVPFVPGTSTVKNPAGVAAFVRLCHQSGLRIVGWFLPTFANTHMALARSLAIVRFRDGTIGFDSFAMDIESNAVADPAVRSSRVVSVGRSLRAAVGATYPLGAIIPAPKGMVLSPNYWPKFPFAGIAQSYNAFVVMGYYTYHGFGYYPARQYTRDNIQLLQAATGNPTEPIHVIGGLATDSGAGQVQGYVSALQDYGAIGGSLYDLASTGASLWPPLAGVPH
jgi:hypothetical protein